MRALMQQFCQAFKFISDKTNLRKSIHETDFIYLFLPFFCFIQFSIFPIELKMYRKC